MSPLVLLGSLGTLVSTLSMLPHLLHAARTRKPSGSAGAWLFGAFAGSIWLTYGLASGDLLIAAPNFVAVPAGLFLGVWSLVSSRTAADTEPAPGAVLPPQPREPARLEAQPHAWTTLDDTLEMPVLAGV